MSGPMDIFIPKPPPPPPPPVPKPPAPLPDPEGPAAKEAARVNMKRLYSQQGRSSTILSARPGGSSGGGSGAAAAPSADFSKRTLGGES